MLASPLGSMAAWTVMVGLFFLFVGASVIFLRYISTGCPMILRISDPAQADYKQSVKTGRMPGFSCILNRLNVI